MTLTPVRSSLEIDLFLLLLAQGFSWWCIAKLPHALYVPTVGLTLLLISVDLLRNLLAATVPRRVQIDNDGHCRLLFGDQWLVAQVRPGTYFGAQITRLRWRVDEVPGSTGALWIAKFGNRPVWRRFRLLARWAADDDARTNPLQ